MGSGLRLNLGLMGRSLGSSPDLMGLVKGPSQGLDQRLGAQKVGCSRAWSGPLSQGPRFRRF